MKISSHPVLRRTLTATAVAGGTAALMLAGISGASAHVGVTPDKTTANSYALLTFGIPHGCEESGTTKVTITLPAELNDAQPTVNPNWTAAKVTEQLAEPKKLADGTSITKRTSQIVYTAKAPLNPELRDALVLSVKLPDAGPVDFEGGEFRYASMYRRWGEHVGRVIADLQAERGPA